MTKTLRRLLRPVVGFCLRHAMHIQDIEQAVKEILVEVAAGDIERQGHRPNISRISAATGLHRRDVMRLFNEEKGGAKTSEGKRASEGKGLISRVIGRWQYDRRFLTPAHRPRTLTIDGSGGEFSELVRSVSNDLNPGTVLRELERVGAVERTARGVKLTAGAYQTKRDAAEGYRMLGEDLGNLVHSVEENIGSAHDLPNLHARTEFDNIYRDSIPEIREWLLNRGTEFHSAVRDYLAKFDRDFTPRSGHKEPAAQKNRVKGQDVDAGVRVVIGTFSLTGDLAAKENIRAKETGARNQRKGNG